MARKKNKPEKEYIVRTMAIVKEERNYFIHAKDEEEAKRLALEGTHNCERWYYSTEDEKIIGVEENR